MLTDASTKTDRFLSAKTMVSRAGGASISNLMKELGVSRITVWRLIREIADKGTTIEREERDGTTYFMVPQGQRGATIAMTQFEMIGVAVAQQIAGYLKGTPMFDQLDSVFAKIATALKHPDMVAHLERKIFDVNEGAMRFGKRDSANIETALDALLRNNPVRLRHVTAEKGEVEFRVDPYTLLFYKKGPYLVGRSHLERHKGEIRKFAFGGIKSLKRNARETFEYPEKYRPRQVIDTAFGIVQGPPEIIRIRFREKVERNVRRRSWHRTQEIGPVENGWFVFQMKCFPSFEVDNWVLSWGASAEVLEPASLRDRIRAEVEAMVGAYKR